MSQMNSEKKITPLIIGVGEEGVGTVEKYSQSEEGQSLGAKFACVEIREKKADEFESREENIGIDYVQELDAYLNSQNLENNPLAMIIGSMDIAEVKEYVKSIYGSLKEKFQSIVFVNIGNWIKSDITFDILISEIVLINIKPEAFSDLMKLLSFGDIFELTEADIIDALKNKGYAIFLQGEANGDDGLKLAIKNAFENAGLDMNDLKVAGMILGLEGDFSIAEISGSISELSSKASKVLSGVEGNSDIGDTKRIKILLTGIGVVNVKQDDDSFPSSQFLPKSLIPFFNGTINYAEKKLVEVAAKAIDEAKVEMSADEAKWAYEDAKEAYKAAEEAYEEAEKECNEAEEAYEEAESAYEDAQFDCDLAKDALFDALDDEDEIREEAEEEYDELKEKCNDAKEAYEEAEDEYNGAKEALHEAEEECDKAEEAYEAAKEAYKRSL